MLSLHYVHTLCCISVMFLEMSLCLFATISNNSLGGNPEIITFVALERDSGWMSVCAEEVCPPLIILPPSGLWPRRWRQASPSNPSISAMSRCTSVTSWASQPSQLSASPSRWSTYSMTSTHSLMLSSDCMMSTRWVLRDHVCNICDECFCIILFHLQPTYSIFSIFWCFLVFLI